MRRKQDWVQIIIILLMLVLLALDKLSTQDAVNILRKMPLCFERVAYGGGGNLRTLSIASDNSPPIFFPTPIAQSVIDLRIGAGSIFQSFPSTLAIAPGPNCLSSSSATFSSASSASCNFRFQSSDPGSFHPQSLLTSSMKSCSVIPDLDLA